MRHLAIIHDLVTGSGYGFRLGLFAESAPPSGFLALDDREARPHLRYFCLLIAGLPDQFSDQC